MIKQTTYIKKKPFCLDFGVKSILFSLLFVFPSIPVLASTPMPLPIPFRCDQVEDPLCAQLCDAWNSEIDNVRQCRRDGGEVQCCFSGLHLIWDVMSDYCEPLFRDAPIGPPDWNPGRVRFDIDSTKPGNDIHISPDAPGTGGVRGDLYPSPGSNDGLSPIGTDQPLVSELCVMER